MTSKRINYLLIAVLVLIQSCSDNRPAGEDAKEFLEHINKVSRPLPKGDHNEFYALLSTDFIATFKEEIDKAKKLDSTGLRQLPAMEMLRVLSLKNSFATSVKESDPKTIIVNWLDSAGKGFPLKNADRYYYSPKKSLETKMIEEGRTFPQVLITKEKDSYKVNPFNSKEYQNNRLEKILEKKSLDELIKESAWLHFQTDRRINWNSIE